jgi:hypothetical protein
MKSKSHVVELNVPAEVAHRFLSDIDNLPRWATVFCRKLEKSADGYHHLETPQGPMLFSIKADAASGVVDMFGGATKDQMIYWPARAVALGVSHSALIFTMFQWPGITDESFEGQSRALASELENMKRILEGGPDRKAEAA